MKINSYKTYISEIPLHRHTTVVSNDRLVLLSIDNIPHILLRTRRDLELRRTIMRVKVKVSSQEPKKVHNIISRILKENSINTILELLDDNYIIAIQYVKNHVKVFLGKVLEYNTGSDIWNIAGKGKMIENIDILNRILKQINIKLKE